MKPFEPVRVIFIDSINESVVEATCLYSKGRDMLKCWYDLLDVDLVETAVYLDDENSILVDEEGLLKPLDKFFVFEGANQSFAGSGVVVATNDEGDTVSCLLPVESIAEKVTFTDVTHMKVGSVRMGGSRCPKCHKLLDAHTGISGTVPKPGDITICFYCGCILVFNEEKELIIADPVVLDKIKESEPDIFNLIVSSSNFIINLRK